MSDGPICSTNSYRNIDLLSMQAGGDSKGDTTLATFKERQRKSYFKPLLGMGMHAERSEVLMSQEHKREMRRS